MLRDGSLPIPGAACCATTTDWLRFDSIVIVSVIVIVIVVVIVIVLQFRTQPHLGCCLAAATSEFS
jgi:Flp pilus assembly protein TadB